MFKVIAEATKGSDRLTEGAAELGSECQTRGLYTDDKGKPVQCSAEKALVDPYHTYGVLSTVCLNCLPHLEKDILGLHEDRTAFGAPTSTDNTSLPGGLESAYAEEAINRTKKRNEKPVLKMKNFTRIFNVNKKAE